MFVRILMSVCWETDRDNQWHRVGNGSLDKGMVVSKHECDRFPKQQAKLGYSHDLKDRNGVVVPPNFRKETTNHHGARASIAPSAVVKKACHAQATRL